MLKSVEWPKPLVDYLQLYFASAHLVALSIYNILIVAENILKCFFLFHFFPQHNLNQISSPEPSCSKLMMLLVNISLKL